MTKKYNRNQRVAQGIKKAIATILQRDMKDPRIDMVTVSSVKLSRDLASAKVFVTFLNKNTPTQLKTSVRVLQNAAGFIRSPLGKIMHLRVVPDLTFIYDNSLVEGMRLSTLISQVIQNEQRNHSVGIMDDDSVLQIRKT